MLKRLTVTDFDRRPIGNVQPPVLKTDNCLKIDHLVFYKKLVGETFLFSKHNEQIIGLLLLMEKMPDG